MKLFTTTEEAVVCHYLIFVQMWIEFNLMSR